MSEIIPDGLSLQKFLTLVDTTLPSAAASTLGTGFLVLAGGGLASPEAMQRTVTWDDDHASTAETEFVVIRLLPKLGVRTVTLGRTSTNDVVVHDSTISKVHAFLHKDLKGEGWSVSDAGSHNGTFVEGVRVAARGDGDPIALQSGKQVRLGSVSLTFMALEPLVGLARSLSRRKG
ncbi:MAG: FHA domain-containing protein [Deltaproteobacteria bacterium]|nr:FHA domain-containing protein [Deltaproteobacteria bacterium]